MRNSKVSFWEKQESIQQGILRHYEVDKLFHGLPAFAIHTSEAIKEMLVLGLNRNQYRLSVLAHLLVEMLLDKHLMEVDQEIVVDYYQHLEQVNLDDVKEYFNQLAPDMDLRQFLFTFDRFKESRFLFHFNDMDKIVFGLSKVYTMATGISIAEEDKKRLILAAHKIEFQLHDSWGILLNV